MNGGVGLSAAVALAPAPTGLVEEVPVAAPTDAELPTENGIVARKALLKQAQAAHNIIDRHAPDCLVVLGGDCLVDWAPFPYLNERYEGDVAIQWVDAHTDIATPAQMPNAHAVVLGNLLGHGDAEFAAAVARPFAPKDVLYLGKHGQTEWEANEMERLSLRRLAGSTDCRRQRAGSRLIQSDGKATPRRAF